MAGNGKVGGNGDILYSITMDTAGSVKSITGLTRNISMLGREMRNINRVYRANGDEAGRLQKTHDAMGKKMDQLREKQKRLTDDLESFKKGSDAYKKQQSDINRVTSEMEMLESQMKQNRNEYAKLNTEADKLRNSMKSESGMLKERAALYRKQGNAQAATVVEQKRLRNELSKTNALIGSEEAQLKKLKAQFGRNSAEVMDHRAKISRLRSSYIDLGNQAKQVGAQMDYLTKKQQLMNTGFGRSLGALKRNRAGLAELRNSMMSVGAGVTAMSYPLMRGLRAGATAVKNFDDTMRKVKATSGATEQQFSMLSDKAREVAANSKFTASETAEALNYMSLKARVVTEKSVA
ncbi:MAG TPA: hypothetical protein IAC14_15555 [Candidatus Scybalomonas excrementigallinarum]|nr:hypothetical protein [Candidatus Scybalomonas excrementigallinarum]